MNLLPFMFGIFLNLNKNMQAILLDISQPLNNLYKQKMSYEESQQKYRESQMTDQIRHAKHIHDQSHNNQSSPYIIKQNQHQDLQYQNSSYDYQASQDFAEEVNQLKSKGKSKHCQAFVATLILIAGIIIGNIVYSNPSNGLSKGELIGIYIGSYVAYLIIGFSCNPILSYLSNIQRGQRFENYYQQVRNMIGRFRFHAECYHYQTRFHTRTVRDRDGNTTTEHYTSEEKVVTHTAIQYLDPVSTKDQSGSVDRIRANTNIVFIHFQVGYKFADPISINNFNNVYNNFRRRNTSDIHQNFNMNYEVPGLIERKTFYVGKLDFNYKAYLIGLGLIGLLWPYSLWVEQKISRFDINFMKILKV